MGEISKALELLVDALGFELVERRPSTDPVGEIALVQLGDVLITLLAPAESGPGFVLPDREPRLSQIVLAAPPAEVGDLAVRVAEAGATAQGDAGSFFVTPAVCTGALGMRTAIVVTGVE